jgi:hypothetical protein
MFVCVSPTEPDASESLCSLNFAARARNVELGPAKRRADAATPSKDKDRALEQARDAARRAAEDADRREARIRQLESELQQQASAGEHHDASPHVPPLPSMLTLPPSRTPMPR